MLGVEPSSEGEGERKLGQVQRREADDVWVSLKHGRGLCAEQRGEWGRGRLSFQVASGVALDLTELSSQVAEHSELREVGRLVVEVARPPSEKRGGIAARSGRRKQGAPGVMVEIHDMQLGVRAVAANVTGEYRDPERDIRRVGSRDESEGELGGTALHVFVG